MGERLAIASICRDLPGPGNPSGGIFVLRRLAGMARIANVTTIQPVPWFPVAASLPDWAREPEREAEAVRIRHAPMFYVPKFLKSVDGYWLYRAIFCHLRALRDAGNVDVVDAHFAYPEGVGAFLAARKLGLPVFVTLRGFEAEYLQKAFIGPQIRYLLHRVDGCICVSHFLQDLAISNGAIPDRTCVIHNAIDDSVFHPGSKAAARNVVGLPQDVPLIVSVGSLISRKRHHVLIDAFAELLNRRPDARLLLVGGGSFERDYPRRLEEQVTRLGIDSAVSFLGNVEADRVADYLRAADVFALGTQREGCCNAVLEALACGLPVVTTPVGDNSWFVRDEENGYIVPVDDVGSMRLALDKVLDRRDWDRRHIAASLGVGNWDGVADRVVKFLRHRLGPSVGGDTSTGSLDRRMKTNIRRS